MSPKLRAIITGAILCAAGIGGVAMLSIKRGGDAAFRTEKTPANESPKSERPYSVTMAPTGEVRFGHVPRRVVTLDANYNEMLVALGQEEKLAATGYRDNYFGGFYQQLDGLKVQLDPGKLTYLATPGGGMFDKELLYALRADVHHIDPVQLASSRGWSRADVDEIARNVAPFLANRYSRDNNYSGSEPYEYYTIWELSGKIAEIYKHPERITGLKAVYDELVAFIQSRLPPEEKRPRVGLVYYNTGRFTTYSLTHEGFGQAHYRDVGARDAFASIEKRTYGGAGGSAGVGTALDAEGLLSLNPDVLIMPFAVYPGAARANYEELLKLKDDALLQRINAFHSGRVYPGGTPLQGPLFYLFQIEMAAKQIYPEIFGPYRDDQKYPREEQLFDRNRVARILRNNVDEKPGKP